MSDDKPDPAALYSQALLDLGRLKSSREETDRLLLRVDKLLEPFLVLEAGNVATIGNWYLHPGGRLVERRTQRDLTQVDDPADLLRRVVEGLAERAARALKESQARTEQLGRAIETIEPGGPWEHSDEGAPAPNSLWLDSQGGVVEVLFRRVVSGEQVLDYRDLEADTSKFATREEFLALHTPHEPRGFAGGLPIPGSWWEFKHGGAPLQCCGGTVFRVLGEESSLHITPRNLTQEYVYLPGADGEIKLGTTWCDDRDPHIVVRVRHVTPPYVDITKGEDGVRLTHAAFRRRYRPVKAADGAE